MVIICFLIISSISYVQLLTFPLERKRIDSSNISNFVPMTSEVCLGTPRQCLDMAFDTGSIFLTVIGDWLGQFYPRYFDSVNSSSYWAKSETEIFPDYTEHYIGGTEAVDLISFKILPEERNFYFNFINGFGYSQKTNFLHAEGNIGLARNYSIPLDYIVNDEDDENIQRFSLINLLYDYNLIKKKIFYIKYSSNETGELVIGEELELKPFESIFYCPCLKYNETLPAMINILWTCKLNKVYLGGDEQDIGDAYAVISNGENFIVGPYQIGMKIIEKYKEYFSDHCFIENELSDYVLVCDQIQPASLPSLTFILGEYLIEIPKNKLFFYNQKKITFALKTRKNFDYWILGNPALKDHQMLFDYEKNLVGFITKKQISSAKKMEIIFWIVNGICAIAFIFAILGNYIRYIKAFSILEKKTEQKAQEIQFIESKN